MKTGKPSTGHLQHARHSGGKWRSDIVKDYSREGCSESSSSSRCIASGLWSDRLGLRVTSCMMLLGGSPSPSPKLKGRHGIEVQIKCTCLEYGNYTANVGCLPSSLKSRTGCCRDHRCPSISFLNSSLSGKVSFTHRFRVPKSFVDN